MISVDKNTTPAAKAAPKQAAKPTAKPAAHSETAKDVDNIESADGGIGLSIARIIQLLMRPELKKWRPTAVIAVLLTLVSSCLEVLSPLLIGDAINTVSEINTGNATLTGALFYLSAGIAIRFAAAGLPQL
ncbi:MAG: hypothetical protein ACPG07_05845, partial [Henriciella sp.]